MNLIFVNLNISQQFEILFEIDFLFIYFAKSGVENNEERLFSYSIAFSPANFNNIFKAFDPV